MTDEPKLTVRTVPMLDTGIGREMGYANDAAFIEAANAEREAALSMLTPEARRRIEQAEEQAAMDFICGKESRQTAHETAHDTPQTRL